MDGEAPLVFESRPSFFLKGSRPSPCRPFLFRNSPPQKNKNEKRQGERAGRAVLRAWRGSGGRHAIGAYCFGSKPPRTRSVRSQGFCWKWVRAKVRITPQIETSSAERAETPRAC